MSAPARTEVDAIFACFLARKEEEIGQALGPVGVAERLPGGWALFYQSRTYLETRDPFDMLVGHGPVVVLDDGRLLEGGSLDHDAAALPRRHGEANR